MAVSVTTSRGTTPAATAMLRRAWAYVVSVVVSGVALFAASAASLSASHWLTVVPLVVLHALACRLS